MKLIVTSIVVVLLYNSCSKGTKVLGVSKTELSAASMMALTNLNPLVAKPGSLLTVKGSGFDSQSRIRIDGQEIKLQNISADGTSGEFIMPQTSRAGAFTLALGTSVKPDGGAVADVARVLLADSAGDGLPIYMAKPADVCSDTKFRDAQGVEQIGTRTCTATSATGTTSPTASSSATASTAAISVANCATDGQTNCLATSDFPAADKSTAAAKIVSGQSVAGVSGTAVTTQLTDCNSDGQQSCTANSQFKAAQVSGLAAKILSTATVAGVAGTIPVCATDGAQSCYIPSSGTIKAAETNGIATSDLKSGRNLAGISGALSNCSSDGATGCVAVGTFPAVDYAALSNRAWDIRAGQTIATVQGKLRVNCRNMVNSSVYNYDGTISSLTNSGSVTGTTADVWDTVDDSNNGATTIPSTNPWTSPMLCGGLASTQNDDNIWLDVTTTGDGTTASTCSTTTAHCSFKDKLSGLEWAKIKTTVNTSLNWKAAVQYCNGLNGTTPSYNGKTGWRLPTLKELLSAYVDGILSLRGSSGFATFLDGYTFVSNFWSGTTSSSGTANAFVVNLDSGLSGSVGKTSIAIAMCVRP